MKAVLLTLVILCITKILSAQYTYTIKADSVKMTGCDSAELILENHTQGVPGFLFNTGNGRTVFKRPLQKINDTLYLVGADTLKIHAGSANAWVQGGNSFGATGVLGTIDSNHLDLYTHDTARARLTAKGNLLIGTTTDNTAKLQVKGGIWSNANINLQPANLDTPALLISHPSTGAGTLLQLNGWQPNVNVFKVTNVGGFAFNDPSGAPTITGDVNGITVSKKISYAFPEFSWAAPNNGINITTGSNGSQFVGGHTLNIGAFCQGDTITNGPNQINIGFNVNQMSNPHSSIYLGFNGTNQSYEAISIGNGADPTADYQLVLGGANASGLTRVRDAYIGTGVITGLQFGTPESISIQPSGGRGTDITGASVTLAGGKATGAGTPGNLIFSTSVAGSSGTTLQSLTERARIIGSNGHFLLGTTADSGNLLQVHGSSYFTGSVRMSGLTSDTAKIRVIVSDTNGNLSYRTLSSWVMNDIPGSSLALNGPVSVDGALSANSVRVKQTGWPDYVFARNYSLPPLTELEKYVQQYNHLPGILSASEVESKGLDLGVNQAALLKKIEELTLYSIDQEKKLQQQARALEQQTSAFGRQSSDLVDVKAQMRRLLERITKLEDEGKGTKRQNHDRQ